MVSNYEQAADFDDLTVELMRVLTIEPPFTAEEYANLEKEDRIERLHAAAIETLDRKSQRIREIVMPVVKASVEEGFAEKGDLIVIAAGMPFGKPGSTNLLRIAEVE